MIRSRHAGWLSLTIWCCWLLAALAAAEESAMKLPDLPHPVTSFGGASIDGNVYIYGGHQGDAHDYYLEGQSQSLWQLNTASGKPEWKEISQGPPLQGLAMVAHDGRLYRLGGFTAKNKQGEKQNLWSVADAASFDPATDQWSEIAALPEPRSSFDAAIAGDKVFVIGGWELRGEGETAWHKTAHVLDLSLETPAWKAIAAPPFERRALSVAALGDKIYAIGGMDPQGPSTRVDVYDIAADKWSEGPAIPGKGMEGFGSAAYAVGERLLVSTFSGLLYRLSDDGQSWVKVQKLERDRFFHRMLPIGEQRLVLVGGASMASGKFAEVDVIDVSGAK